MPARVVLLFVFLFYACFPVVAQTIKGEVLDMDSKHTVADVTIQNIHTGLSISTNEQGGFVIAAVGGQLLEFKKQGYKNTHVRLPKGYMPSFFRIIISKGVAEIRDMDVAKTTRYDYKSDSIRFHDLYVHDLDFPKLNSFDAIAHPFSALSSKNRQIWQFQDDYTAFEQEKYVDRTFNAALITKFTGLTGDSLRYYMRRFRPTYEQVRNMNDYVFFNFIKTTVHQYRSLNNDSRGAQ